MCHDGAGGGREGARGREPAPSLGHSDGLQSALQSSPRSRRRRREGQQATLQAQNGVVASGPGGRGVRVCLSLFVSVRYPHQLGVMYLESFEIHVTAELTPPGPRARLSPGPSQAPRAQRVRLSAPSLAHAPDHRPSAPSASPHAPPPATGPAVDRAEPYAVVLVESRGTSATSPRAARRQTLTANAAASRTATYSRSTSD